MKTNKMRLLLLVLSAFGTAAFSVSAQTAKEQPLQEVFQTELVYPQEKGEFQTTFAPRFSRRRDERETELPVRLEYGITDRWQVEVQWVTFSRSRSDFAAKSEKGTGDVSVSTKYSFLNIKKSNFHSSVQFEVNFPTGGAEQNADESFIEYEPSASFAKDFPRLRRLQIFSQIGFNFKQPFKKTRPTENKDSAAPDFILNGGFFVPYKNVRLVTEINWKTNQWNKSGTQSEIYLTPGLVYKLPGKWEIGIGIPLGVSGDADKFRTIGQAIFEF